MNRSCPGTRAHCRSAGTTAAPRCSALSWWGAGSIFPQVSFQDLVLWFPHLRDRGAEKPKAICKSMGMLESDLGRTMLYPASGLLKSRVILPFCPPEADFLPKGEMSSKLSEMLPCAVLSSKACVAVPRQCCICCPVLEGLHCRSTAVHSVQQLQSCAAGSAATGAWSWRRMWRTRSC